MSSKHGAESGKTSDQAGGGKSGAAGGASSKPTQPPPARMVDLVSYFTDAFGFKELSSVEPPVPSVEGLKSVGIKSHNGEYFLFCGANRKEYRVGSFQLISLEELDAQCRPILQQRAAAVVAASGAGPAPPRGGASPAARAPAAPAGGAASAGAPPPTEFNVFVGHGPKNTINLRMVDVAALQAEEDNLGATFQVASNFNCLEFTHAGDSPAAGIARYIYDKTQGPAASISCAPATLFRNYFLPHGGPAVAPGARAPAGAAPPAKFIGQLEKQIEMLGALPQIPVRNGYIVFNKDAVEALPPVASLPWGKLCVGWQRDTRVTSGLRGAEQLEACDRATQHVSQVFCAALNFPGQPKAVANHPAVKEVAQNLLTLQYRATILAAILHHHQRKHLPGSRRLFLTLLGGGVFENSSESLINALQANVPLIRASGLDVRMIVFSPGEGSLMRALGEVAKAAGGAVHQVD